MFEEWYLNELFSNKIRDIWKLTDYYLLKSIFNILEKTAILPLLKEEINVDNIIQRKEFPDKVHSALQWMLDRLVMEKYLTKVVSNPHPKYKLTDKTMDYNLTHIKEEAAAKAPDSIAAFNMIQLIADNYPDYLSGKKTGVDIVFSPDNIEITNDYYRNNLFYNVHNIAGAKILNWDIENRQNPTIVEIGGGLGGGTKQFLIQRIKNELSINNFTYYFTDIANKMLRTTRKGLLSITDKLDSFNFKKLDFNKSLLEQEIPPNSLDIIWGVNAAHVATDLKYSLTQFYETLKPNGSIILSETVRPVGNQMIQQELILNTLDDYWNVKLDPDIRPRHGFMDWRDWVNALKKIGFKNVTTIPDMNYLESEYDNCYVTVIRGEK